MEIGVFGKGKTGREVIKLLGAKYVFDSQNLPDSKIPLDALIVFIPPKAFKENLPLLLTLNCPLIIGTTGIEWTAQLRQEVQSQNRLWIHGSNFSLGMLLIRKAFLEMKASMSILNGPEITITETHHIDKKDAPSGTALLWNEWLGSDNEIKSIRESDTIGLHEAKIMTEMEKITITHQATDRKLFAEGALWCAKAVIQLNFESGLYSFENIVDRYLKEKNV